MLRCFVLFCAVCVVLFCAVLCCAVLFCVGLFCFVLFCLCCFVLFCVVLFCFVLLRLLFCVVVYCFALFRVALCRVALFCFDFCSDLFCFVVLFLVFWFVCLFVCLSKALQRCGPLLKGVRPSFLLPPEPVKAQAPPTLLGLRKGDRCLLGGQTQFSFAARASQGPGPSSDLGRPKNRSCLFVRAFLCLSKTLQCFLNWGRGGGGPLLLRGAQNFLLPCEPAKAQAPVATSAGRNFKNIVSAKRFGRALVAFFPLPALHVF